MKRLVIVLFVLLCGRATFGKDGLTVSSVPDRFLIARHTFIDVGPPNDFYEIISVRGTSTGATVEKVTITPPGDACIQPPTVEMSASVIPDPVITGKPSVTPVRERVADHPSATSPFASSNPFLTPFYIVG